LPGSVLACKTKDDAQNDPQPGENEAKVVTDDAEDDVGGPFWPILASSMNQTWISFPGCWVLTASISAAKFF
jgi:hypothetical protein